MFLVVIRDDLDCLFGCRLVSNALATDFYSVSLPSTVNALLLFLVPLLLSVSLWGKRTISLEMAGFVAIKTGALLALPWRVLTSLAATCPSSLRKFCAGVFLQGHSKL